MESDINVVTQIVRHLRQITVDSSARFISDGYNTDLKSNPIRCPNSENVFQKKNLSQVLP